MNKLFTLMATFFAIIILFAITPASSTLGSGDVDAAGSHQWTQGSLEEGESVDLPSGASATRTSEDGAVKYRWCPGKETNPGAHGPHEVVEYKKADGSVSGGNDQTTTEVGGGTSADDGCNVTVDGDNSTVNISGDHNNVTVNGDGNDIHN